MLKNCNYFHQKSKNNNTTHKSGEGKLMITNGLSIKEFQERFLTKT